jgi:hypothetical protein
LLLAVSHTLRLEAILLAAVYVAGFAASVAALGVITYVVTASALERLAWRAK